MYKFSAQLLTFYSELRPVLFFLSLKLIVLTNLIV